LKDENAGQRPAEPVLSDYDQNPGRVRLARSVLHRHAVAGDVHELVARRFVAEGFARVLYVGCGEGELARYLPDGTWVGLDNSQTMLARAVRDYLIGKQVAPDRAQAVAAATEPPLSVTKRGALLFARKSR
jgi:trans-aconitate methyltransferase